MASGTACGQDGWAMITSSSNPKIKLVRRLLSERRARERQRAYVIESSRWLAELPAAGVRPLFVLATGAWEADAAHQAILATLQAPVFQVDERLLSETGETETAAGILAVVPMVEKPLPPEPGLLVVLDGIRDPGNLGTILRTAYAAGCDGVLLAPGCVDPYNPKVVRSSMGAHLRLPIRSLNWESIGDHCQGLAVFLAEANAPDPYDAVDWCKPCALIVGGEAHGAGASAARLAAQRVSIPMQPGAESLNAAVSAGILLFEAARQRRDNAKTFKRSNV